MAVAFGAVLGTSEVDAGSSLTVTTSALVPAGGRVVIVTGGFATGTTATGSGGALTWATDGHVVNGSDARYHSSILSADCPAGLAASTVLTVTFSGATNNKTISCFYITGAVSGASGYLDGAAVGGNGTVTAWATASLATANADDILISGGYIDAVTSNTPGTGYTEIHDSVAASSGVTFTSEYQVVSATGSYTGNGTWLAAGSPWTMVMAAYKAAGGAVAVPVLGSAFQAIPFMAPTVFN
jgi:hypothetical protein